MNTVLITGGAGFIGSHLSEKLLDLGYSVIVVDNFNDFYDPSIKINNIKKCKTYDNFKVYENDIRDFEAMNKIFEENSIDSVINLAGMAGVRPSIEDALLYEDVNCKGFQVILENMKNHKITKLVAASSSSVYGNNKKVPFSETDIVDFAISPYAATKKSNEVMGHVYHDLYKMNLILLRFFTVYGPRQRPDLAIHKFTDIIYNNKSLPMFGDGNTGRDYTYVDDIVDGIIKSLFYLDKNENVFEIFNLGNSSPITLKNMIKTIENAMGKKANIEKMPMQAGDVELTYADITKAQKLLGYKPQITFEDGIKKFVNWYLNEKGGL